MADLLIEQREKGDLRLQHIRSVFADTPPFWRAARLWYGMERSSACGSTSDEAVERLAAQEARWAA